MARLAGATPVEQALVRALEARYQTGHVVSADEFCAWNDAYSAAMRIVHKEFATDLDVCALFAEALINRTPWFLWNLTTGEPADGADTLEAMQVLQDAMRLMDSRGVEHHPGVHHMYVHTMEMSPWPERALRAADGLREIAPDAGHLLHMPSHIDVLCGQYHAGLIANERAIEADRRFAQHEPANSVYRSYRVHDYHFKIYSAMFLSQSRPAMAAALELAASLPEAYLRSGEPQMADWAEAFVAMKVHVWVRFGKWSEIIAEALPVDQELYCFTTALLHYAKGIAHAARGDVASAELQRAQFGPAVLRVPETRLIFNNTCLDILPIAAAMLDGEIAYRSGDFEQAFASLRRAVAVDDGLEYEEPWAWMQPARHALGALLLEQGRVAEAAQVYREDLGLDRTLSRPAQHPDNIWSLHGYVECLLKLGRVDEAEIMQSRLDLASARADVEIGASCYCRGSATNACCN